MSSYFERVPLPPCRERVSAAVMRKKMGRGANELEIPFFGAVEGDEMIERYESEKRKIQKLYRGQDLVEVSLKQLTK
ncbi:MAG: hypothetical protein V4487_01695 [Chlamydiota bacterium]